MRVGAEVDRDTVDGAVEIGAVIELEAAQIVLVRFAAAAVLGDREAGDLFQDLARPQERSRRDLFLIDRPRRRGLGDADEVGFAPDLAGPADRRERRRGARRGRGTLCAARGRGRTRRREHRGNRRRRGNRRDAGRYPRGDDGGKDESEHHVLLESRESSVFAGDAQTYEADDG